jgi:hypothetical protein
VWLNLRDTLPFASPVPQSLPPSVQRQSRRFDYHRPVPRAGAAGLPSCSPVWSETIMSADQSTEATAALPRVAVPSCP